MLSMDVPLSILSGHDAQICHLPFGENPRYGPAGENVDLYPVYDDNDIWNDAGAGAASSPNATPVLEWLIHHSVVLDKTVFEAAIKNAYIDTIEWLYSHG